MVIRLYEYLFYKLYQWSIKLYGEEYYNKYSASLMVAAVLLINTITVLVIFFILSDVAIIPPNTSIYLGGVVAFVYGVVTYTYFSYRNRYLIIIKRYKNENNNEAKRGNMMVFVYVIGSFILLVISGFLAIYLNN